MPAVTHAVISAVTRLDQGTLLMRSAFLQKRSVATRYAGTRSLAVLFPALSAYGALGFAILAAPSTAHAQPAVPPTGASGDGATTSSANTTGAGTAVQTSPTSATVTAGAGDGAATGAKATTTADPLKGPEKQVDPGYDVTGSAGARAAGMAPPGVNTGNFMDTRLTWTFGDDDFTHATGELIPLSPTFSIGDRPQYRLFFDGLNSRFAGRENLTHLVMYKKMPGFIPRLTTEAAVVLRFDFAALAANTGQLNSALYDSGSYLRVFYRTGADVPAGKAAEGVSGVFFPLDTDRMRLGYLYDNSWGGTAATINQSIFPRIQGSSPGFKLQYDSKDFYAFVGFKTATIVQPEKILVNNGTGDAEVVRVGETNYGVLGGLGVDITENFRADLGAGFFQQGKFDLEDVRGKSVWTAGSSARLVVHQNMPVPASVDFQLYRNDPSAPMALFKPTDYKPDQLAWSISAEGDYLVQHLKDFDSAGATKNQGALAGSLQGVLQAGYLRASATAIVRNLNYVVRNVPGFIPFETLPSSASSSPEIFGSAAIDYYLKELHLTPGFGGGVQLPSTFRSEFTEGGVTASRTVVVRAQGNESILPFGKDRTAVIQARASLKWDLSTTLSAVGWFQFVRDNNGTLIVRDPQEGSASLRVFQSPNRIGLGLALQARF